MVEIISALMVAAQAVQPCTVVVQAPEMNRLGSRPVVVAQVSGFTREDGELRPALVFRLWTTETEAPNPDALSLSGVLDGRRVDGGDVLLYKAQAPRLTGGKYLWVQATLASDRCPMPSAPAHFAIGEPGPGKVTSRPRIAMRPSERGFFPPGFSPKDVDYETEDDRLLMVLPDRTHVTLLFPSAQPNDPLILETQIAPHATVLSNRKTYSDFIFGGATHSIWVTVLARIRIHNADSAPVRMPSFMPKATYQLLKVSKRQAGQPWSQTLTDWGLKAEVGHHSNGQDGCVFVADGMDCAGVTQLSETSPGSVFVNTKNGSFSHNYVRLSPFLRIGHVSDSRFTPSQRLREVSWTVTTAPYFEFELKAPGLGGSLDEIAGFYGKTRVGLRSEVEKRNPRGFLSRWMLSGRFEQIVGKSKMPGGCGSGSSPRCAGSSIFEFQASARIRRVEDVSLFLRAYAGQDYMNQLFFRDMRRVELGLSFDVNRRAIRQVPVLPADCLATERRPDGTPTTAFREKELVCGGR